MKLFKKALVILPPVCGLTGGGVMNKRNLEIAKECAEKVIVMNLKPTKSNNIFLLIDMVLGYVANVSRESEKDGVFALKGDPDIDVIFLTSSLYGKMAQTLHLLFPSKIVITIFHNAEYRYAIKSYKTNIFSLGLLSWIFCSYLVERKSIKYSNVCFVLSPRDLNDLKKVYQIHKTILLPMSILDAGCLDYVLNKSNSLKLLFVGSDFFANIEGLRWFISEVLPFITVELLIVGNGLEKYKEEFQSDNIQVLGRVERIEDIYAIIDIVICPIKVGSGMKTKTAEALMYGRPILGTSEAFVGYDNLKINDVGHLCNTAIEYIKEISYLDKNRTELVRMAHAARASYEAHYSIKSSIEIINQSLPEILSLG